MSEGFNEIETDSQDADEKPNKQVDREPYIKEEIDSSRSRIKSLSGELPISENGFFMLNEKLYGTVNAWSERFKMPYNKVYQKIRKSEVSPTIGKTSLNLIGRYYPESIFINSDQEEKDAPMANGNKTEIIEGKQIFNEKSEEAKGLPIANKEGYFKEKEIGTINYWARCHKLDKEILTAHVQKAGIPSVEGKTHDGKETLLYPKHYIEELVNNFHKQLLIKLHEEKKLPRFRIKKHSTLHHALEGDILLLIPEKYTGIYKWLKNELKLNKLKSGQVYVLFEKRNGVSVVFKSELEEIQ